MFQSRINAGILTACGFLWWTTGVMAQEPKLPGDKEKSAGLANYVVARVHRCASM